MQAPSWRWSFLTLVAAVVAGTVTLHFARLPTGADGYYFRGLEDNRRGRFQAAVANFDKALELEPNRADTHEARALAWVRLGQPFRALDDAEAALRIHETSADAFFVRGEAQRLIGREEAAMRDYDRALDLDATFPTAAAAKASLLFDQGRYDEALDEARLAWEGRFDDDPPPYGAPLIAWASRTLAGDGPGADEELAATIADAGLDRGRLAAKPPAVEAWMEGVRLLAKGDAPAALERFRHAAAAGEPHQEARERAWAAAERLVLGFRCERVNREISDSLSFGEGLLVRSVRDGGPAAAAGLSERDRILRIGAEEANEDVLARIVREARPETSIAWEGERRGQPISGVIRPVSAAPTR